MMTGKVLRAWLAVLLCVAVIGMFSGEDFSAASTSGLFTKLLRWLDPDMSWGAILRVHAFARRAAHLTEYAGIIEGDIEPAEPMNRRVDYRLRNSLVSRVAGDGDCITALVLDFGNQNVERCLASRRYDNLGTFPGEQPRGCIAYPGTCARNDSHLIREHAHLRLLT